MDTADGYRDYAKECLRWAAAAKTEEERDAFLAMAEQWVEAALRVEGFPSFSNVRSAWPPEARH